MKLKVIIPIILLGAGGGAAWYFTQSADAATDAQSQRSLQVKKGELLESATATGTIEPHVQVEVKSRTAGEVVEILVNEGQQVKAGDLLVRLDPVDVERELEGKKIALRKLEAQLGQAKSALNVASLQASEARANAKVSQEGTDLGVTSGTATRSATSASKVASAQVAAKQADIVGVEASIESAKVDIELAERKVAETQIKAPFDGTVLAINVEKGTMVASAFTNVNGGDGVVTLADLTDLRVIGQIDEAQVGKVAAAQAVAVRVDAYPDRSFEGVVERVSSLGVNTSNVVTFDVEIRVTDKDGSLLKSGMSADVEITTKKTDDALLIPMSAIGTKGGQRFVKMQTGEERFITTGQNDGARIQVTTGLVEGDRIMAVAVTQTAAAAPQQSNSPFPSMGGGRGQGGGNRGGGRRM